MGGKHTTFNMALWQQDFAASATPADLDALIRGIRELPIEDRRAGIHAAAAALARSAKSDGAPAGPDLHQRLSADDDCRRARRRRSASATRFVAGSRARNASFRRCPATATAWRRPTPRSSGCCDAFFTIKPLRMAAQKLPNVFADAGRRGFPAHGLPDAAARTAVAPSKSTASNAMPR